MGDSIRKFGAFNRKILKLHTPGLNKPIDRAFKKFNIRPDDPANLAPRMGLIEEAPETQTERYLRRRTLG